MADAPALHLLVGEVAGFLDASWGREPRHVAATADRAAVAELLTIDDVDRMVACSGLRAPAFRLVEQGRTLPQASVTRQVRIGSRPVADLVDTAAVHRAVADGATLVLQGLHRSFPPVAAFCRDLERTLTHPIQANAYLTPPVAQGLDLHGDPHDVFAVQTYGTKRWVVHPPGGGDPWDLELTPGDVLYLPAGVRHAAQTVGTPSLHLTIGVRTITWRQLLDRALGDALSGLDGLDRPLPAAWADEPAILDARLRDRLAEVAARLRASGDLCAVAEAEAERFWSGRTPDLTGGLRDLLEVDHLDDHTTLRRRTDLRTTLTTTDDGRVEVVLPDRVMRLPAAVRPALERILAARVLRPGDLDDLMDTDSRAVLCRRLVREGILTVDRGGVAGD